MTGVISDITGQLVRLSDVLAAADEQVRHHGDGALRPWPTGFDPLDGFLSGGLRPGELTVLGGAQGLGKTTLALQVARHTVAQGRPVLYVSFEHHGTNLLERLLAAEAGERATEDAITLRALRSLIEGDGSAPSLSDKMAASPAGADALSAIAPDLDLLFVLRGSVRTTIPDIAAAASSIADACGQHPMVVVDYIQKVFSDVSADELEARMARVAGELKDLALSAGVPVLVVSSSDAAGISDGVRLRTQHLRGASALAFEADVVLVLNEKFDVVARHHLVYGAANAERFRAWVVLSIEKNRGGLAAVDLEFQKRFDQARYERRGQVVKETLVDARVFTE